MTKKEVKELLARYRSGDCKSEEKDFLERWYNQAKAEDLDLDIEELERIRNHSWDNNVNPNRRVMLFPEKHNSRFAFWKVASAAILIIGLAFGINYYLSDSNQAPNEKYSNSQTVMPGGNSATLIMEDGQEIQLDELQDGHQIEVGGSLLHKNKDGELVISMLSPNATAQISHVSFNTISTPKGGNYKVILADGTNVWLNSSSVLRFPTVFDNNERRVELTGEGYFDVIEDHNKPFIVASRGQEVQVLGTQFNVSAYADEENIKTTLIEGSVSVRYKNQARTIRPGEQSVIDKNGQMKIASVDVAFAKAWKEGYFAFDKLSVEEAMNQISRWYDVDVTFKGKIPNKELTGQISRKVKLSTIIEIMEYNGMDLDFKNNTLLVKE